MTSIFALEACFLTMKGSLDDIVKEAVQVSTLALKMAIMIGEWKEDNEIECPHRTL